MYDLSPLLYLIAFLIYLSGGFAFGWLARLIIKDKGIWLLITSTLVGGLIGLYVGIFGLKDKEYFWNDILYGLTFNTFLTFLIAGVKKLYVLIVNKRRLTDSASKNSKSKVKSPKSFTKRENLTKDKNPIGTLNIFISYRRNETSDVTGRLYDRLIQQFGTGHIFKDVDSIPLGVDFKEYLDEVVSKCKVLIAVIGKNWLNAKTTNGQFSLEDARDFLRIEIESALKRNIPVIPALVQGARIPREDELPPSLKNLTYRNGIPIRSDPDFHKDVDRLISGLEKILGT